jgi:F-type H+-transporting ATPase subunit b
MPKIWAFAALVAMFYTCGVSPAWADEPEGHDAPHDGAAEHGNGAAAAGHDAHHAPTFDDINWYYGLLFESEGAEPSLLFRPKGMPVPFLGYVLNALALYALIYRFAKKGVKEGLARRKATIERGMKDAADHRAAAKARLADYEQKLASIDEEVERVRTDMRHAGELERARILSEARARRERMERDARLLVEQELAAARELLLKETVESALRSASETLKAKVTPSDHARLADEYLSNLSTVKGLAGASRSSV